MSMGVLRGTARRQRAPFSEAGRAPEEILRSSAKVSSRAKRCTPDKGWPRKRPLMTIDCTPRIPISQSNSRKSAKRFSVWNC
ncbi:conserved hypothetical protein, partial [Ricinus communis]